MSAAEPSPPESARAAAAAAQSCCSGSGDDDSNDGSFRRRRRSSSSSSTTTTGVILFYKYHPLSDDASSMERYRLALEALCASLRLTGRILVGVSSASEGINGTLAGPIDNVRAFTRALMGQQRDRDDGDCGDDADRATVTAALQRFRDDEKEFFDAIGVEPLRMQSEDFKWSTSTASNSCVKPNGGGDEEEDADSSPPLFPDLNVKLVKELIGTGGVLSSISIDETSQGYLTPRQWHEALQSATKKNDPGNDDGGNGSDTVLIDCRNTKEYQIGHFDGAVDPRTTTFSQFPKWARDNRHLLADKKVLMYCTGGIRCEKVRHPFNDIFFEYTDRTHTT